MRLAASRDAAPGPAGGPFGALAQGLRIDGGTRPSPLDATSIAVSIRGGLATVTTVRRFRNAESSSIEATLTYPVPIDAVPHGLVVRIGGRRLVGRAVARAEARDAYEQAMDQGRSAVLHEEPLKGVHILSVGQIPPGADVAVETVWSTALGVRGGRDVLGIPTTVGQVYGRLALDPGDDLSNDGPPATAEVTVAAETGGIVLCGEPLASGAARAVPLDRHITLSVATTSRVILTGTAADGRSVSLSIRDDAGGDAPLDLAVLFDRSGSTSDLFGTCGTSVHATAAEALAAAASMFEPADRMSLWQFDDQAEAIGTAQGPAAADLARRIGPPRGGTEIGAAIEAVLAGEDRPGDILLVTDGRSGALDVHDLAARGRRISTLLCGPASLDALPGHLAALTGGTIMAVGGGRDDVADLTAAIETLVGQLRHPATVPAPKGLSEFPDRLDVRRGGAAISAAWSGEPRRGVEADAIGAYAAGLALPSLDAASATRCAVAHGLVSHLTSLLVVDRDGPVQGTIPAQRKVPLPAPAMASVASAAPRPASVSFAPLPASPPGTESDLRVGGVRPRSRSAAPSPDAPRSPQAPNSQGPSPPVPSPAPPRDAARRLDVAGWFGRVMGRRTHRIPAPDHPGPSPLRAAAAAIEWGAQGQALAQDEFDGLEAWIAAAIRSAAALPAVALMAQRLGMTPLALVVALMAALDPSDRTRARIARRIAGIPEAERNRLGDLLGL